MRYLMFVCVDPSAEPFDPAQDNVEEWVASNDKKGTRVIGHRLEHVNKAKTVRVRKGKLLVTDGPFADTKEWTKPFRSRRSIRWPVSDASKSGPCGPVADRSDPLKPPPATLSRTRRR